MADVSKGLIERGSHVLPNSPLKGTSIEEEPIIEGTIVKKASSMKEEVKAIKLSNNYISSLTLLLIPSLKKTIDTHKILWLDLSFNHITTIIDAFIAAFPNTTTLYLHANQIAKLSEIKKLSQFQSLKSLSMFGNPVEENKHYRNMVLHTCTHLTQFDNSPVTQSERKRCDIWANTFRKKLHPENYW